MSTSTDEEPMCDACKRRLELVRTERRLREMAEEQVQAWICKHQDDRMEILRLREALEVIARNVEAGAVHVSWCGDYARKTLAIDEGSPVTEADVVLDAAVARLMKAVTNMLQEDGHPWSARPCETCRNVSAILGYDFGCVKLAKKVKA